MPSESRNVKALVCHRGRVTCESKIAPEVGHPTDVRIRVTCAAICRTDAYVASGRIHVPDGRVPGHEFTGIVDSAGAAVTRVRPGDRVVVNPLIACGDCPSCRTARPHQCVAARFLGIDCDGAFAELVVVDESMVHVLPAGIPDTVGAYAEPLAATMAVLDADLPPGASIAVTGTGRIATLTEFILREFGHDVHAATSDANEYDVVVETNLCSSNLESTIRLLKPGGLLVMKSRQPETVEISPLVCIPWRLRIECVYYADFGLALGHLARWSPQLQRFAGSEWPLAQHEQAFAEACEDETAKVYFRPNG